MERLDHRALFSEKNYENILRAFAQEGLSTKKKMIVALDELQFAPQAPGALKYLYDHHDIKFIVTGSSSYYLKNFFSESLAGRKKLFELFPLDFGEVLDFHDVSRAHASWATTAFAPAEYERTKALYEAYIAYGGFPEVVLANRREEKMDLLHDIVSSYVNMDIATLSDFRNHERMFSLMRMLADRIGTKLDYAKLARLSGITSPTLMNYIAFFEATYLLARLPVFAKSPDREIVKAKKVYFCDNGIANTLAQLGSGTQFEQAVFTQLRHHGTLAYYARKTGNEIDFLLNGNRALEVKESPSAGDADRLARLAHDIGIRQTRLIGRRPVSGFSNYISNYIWGGMIR